MPDDTFDVVIIGSGPGGYVAAIRAAKRGLRTACVEVAQLGGVCNNVGCIPTKALLESAAHAARVEHLAEFGVTVGQVGLDLMQAAKRARKVADQGAKGIAYLFRKNKVELVQGWGRLAKPTGASGLHRVVVTDAPQNAAGNPIGIRPATASERALDARHVVIATGSRAKGLPMLQPDGDRIWSSDHAVYPPTIPASLAIIGGGAVGMEFADVYASFGTRVTVLEAMDRVLPVEDPDVSAVVEKAYRKRGISVHTGARVERAQRTSDGVELSIVLKEGATDPINAERVLVAVGRAPVVEGLGLEDAGVRLDRGFITTDARMCTNVPGIYAIGDVTKPPLLAHKAWAEAAAVVGAIAQDTDVDVDYSSIPSVTYCHPEVASVGLTEARAREQGLDIAVGRFPWSANGRARAIGETEGFIKLIFETGRYGKLLGAHLVGPHVSELISELVVGRLVESTIDELEMAVHPHPTLADAIPEAALDALRRAIHI